MGGGGPFDLFKCVESWKKEKWLRENESEEDRPQSVGLRHELATNISPAAKKMAKRAHIRMKEDPRSFPRALCPVSFLFLKGDPVITTAPENETKCTVFFFFLIGRRTFFSRVARQTVCLHHNKRYAGEKATEFKFHQWLEQKNAGGVIITPPTHCVSVDNIARATNSLTVFSLLRPASRR